MELPRHKHAGVATNGVLAMSGRRSRLVAKIRETMQQENVIRELTASLHYTPGGLCVAKP